MNLDQRIEFLERAEFTVPEEHLSPELKQWIKDLVSEAIDYCTPELPDKRYGQITARLVDHIESKKQELGL